MGVPTQIGKFPLSPAGKNSNFEAILYDDWIKVFGLRIVVDGVAVVGGAFIFYHVALCWPLANAILATGAGSLFFGMAAIASRTLGPIGLHAAWNFVDWTIGGKDRQVLGTL